MRIDLTMGGLLGMAVLGAVLGGGYPGPDGYGRDRRLGAPIDTGVLRETTAMRVNRAAHTATPLQGGRVLVVGGFVEKGLAADAEIYDPSTDAFSALSPMPETRHSHTATTLQDGTVLIAGGYGAGTTTLGSAEVFDPRTKRFTPTGGLVAARADHVAVLLANGTVFIAGGMGPEWTFLASAELYDPATGRFTSTGGMAVARESHVAVRLADGRVLVAGGHLGRRADMRLHASTEVYDPAAGSFRRLGDMRVPRHKHDAVRLHGGRVLIAGGAAQAEVYDPNSGAFTLVPGAARMAGLFSAVAALPCGGALIIGGYGNGGGPRASAWVYR